MMLHAAVHLLRQETISQYPNYLNSWCALGVNLVCTISWAGDHVLIVCQDLVHTHAYVVEPGEHGRMNGRGGGE